jgi:hypothetical protein
VRAQAQAIASDCLATLGLDISTCGRPPVREFKTFPKICLFIILKIRERKPLVQNRTRYFFSVDNSNFYSYLFCIVIAYLSAELKKNYFPYIYKRPYLVLKPEGDCASADFQLPNWKARVIKKNLGKSIFSWYTFRVSN